MNEAVEVFKRASLRFEIAQALIQRAHLSEATGELNLAESDAREALEIAQTLQAADLEAQARFILGKVLSHSPDRFSEAIEGVEAARKYFKERKILSMSWAASYERGELEAKRGNKKEAREFYEDALKDLEALIQQLPDAMREGFLRDRKQERILEALEKNRREEA